MKAFKRILIALGICGLLISVPVVGEVTDLESILSQNSACRISGLAHPAFRHVSAAKKVSGTKDSICIHATKLSALTGVSAQGVAAHLALIGPDSAEPGQANSVKGVGDSDIVLVNFNVRNVYGRGRKLHVFGGRIQNLKGVFDEIHLHGDAVIENISERKGIRY